ncbi:MAG: hypothetical protein KJ703_06185 [Alphaproteobacteria bacterium]|nr:hypothetical protein [Alphaproteobacteria bacterium]
MKKSALTLGAAAVAAMIAAPVAASDRLSAPIAGGSEMGNGESPIVWAIALGVAVAAVLVGIELFGDDDDEAVSP